MADVMDRLQKLLALATSPVEEEARSAALVAVRLIHEYKIELFMPGTRVQAKASEDPRPQVKTPPPPKVPLPRFGTRPDALVTNYNGICRHCGARYARGDTIWWLQGKGATHYNCQSYWYR